MIAAVRFIAFLVFLAAGSAAEADPALTFKIENVYVIRQADGCLFGKISVAAPAVGDSDRWEATAAAILEAAKQTTLDAIEIDLRRDDLSQLPRDESLLAHFSTVRDASKCKMEGQRSYFYVAGNLLTKRELDIRKVHLALAEANFDADPITKKLFNLPHGWLLPSVQRLRRTEPRPASRFSIDNGAIDDVRARLQQKIAAVH